MLFLCLCVGQSSHESMESFDQSLSDVEAMAARLAEHFCEEENRFKIEECLEIFRTICENVKKCKQVCFIAGFGIPNL